LSYASNHVAPGFTSSLSPQPEEERDM